MCLPQQPTISQRAGTTAQARMRIRMKTTQLGFQGKSPSDDDLDTNIRPKQRRLAGKSAIDCQYTVRKPHAPCPALLRSRHHSSLGGDGRCPRAHSQNDRKAESTPISNRHSRKSSVIDIRSTRVLGKNFSTSLVTRASPT